MKEEKDEEKISSLGYFKASFFLVNICFLPISIGVKINTASFNGRLLNPTSGNLVSFQKIHAHAGASTDRDPVTTWTFLKGKHAEKRRN